MRNVAVRNAMGPTKRRRQPRTFALLPSRAGRAVGALRGAAGRRARPHRRPGPDARPEFARRGSGMVRALRDGIVLRALSRRSDGRRNGPSSACARPTAWSWCATPTTTSRPSCRSRSRRRRPGAVFHRRRELVLLHEGHDPKPGSTARHAGGRPVRPAPPCPARHPFRLRPAGAADDRPCGGRRHGGRRRARLHPYRRGQGAARLGRADRPGRRHQHGRHRRRRRRLRAGRDERARRAFPPRLRRTPIR